MVRKCRGMGLMSGMRGNGIDDIVDTIKLFPGIVQNTVYTTVYIVKFKITDKI